MKVAGISNVDIIKQKTEKFSNINKAQNRYKRKCNEKCDMNISFDCKTRNVVYKFTCKLCSEFYIGMTNNIICTRYLQHKNAINRNDEKNALVDHFKKKHNNVKVSTNMFKFEILEKCRNKFNTAVVESKLIENLKPAINRKFELNHSRFM